eukprot:XP_011617583.1 PREDICTED: uncharacterized protein LOC105418761 [Takifugu rubripes]
MTSWMPIINPNLRSKAAVRMRAVVMSTPFHSPLRGTGTGSGYGAARSHTPRSSCQTRHIEADGSNDGPEEPTTGPSPQGQSYKGRGMRWRAAPLMPNLVEFENEDETEHDRNSWTPLNYLEQYIDRDLMKTIADCTNTVIVREYNLKMGGVDLIDRMISYYRMSSRTKKWTMRMLMHFTDLALANSWLLYRKDLATCGAPRKSIMQFLEFRMEVARTFLAQHHSQEDDADFPELSEGEDDSLQGKKRPVMAVPHVGPGGVTFLQLWLVTVIPAANC